MALEIASRIVAEVLFHGLTIPQGFIKDINHVQDLAFGPDQAAFAAQKQKIAEYVAQLEAEYRANPTEDSIFSQIIQFHDNGQVPTTYEQALLFFFAGVETTIDGIEGFLLELLGNFQLLLDLKAAKQLGTGQYHVKVANLTKDLLRRYTPVPMIFKDAPADGVELGGYFIPGGALCAVFVFAAHMDSKTFPDPEVVKTDREYTNASYAPFGRFATICPAAGDAPTEKMKGEKAQVVEGKGLAESEIFAAIDAIVTNIASIEWHNDEGKKPAFLMGFASRIVNLPDCTLTAESTTQAA